MEHPISVDRLSPQVAKVSGPDASPNLKAMAAGGLAPLPPRDLVTALYVLSYDADEKISEKAKSSLGAMPANVLLGAVEQIERGEVLDGIARRLVSNVNVTEGKKGDAIGIKVSDRVRRGDKVYKVID